MIQKGSFPVAMIPYVNMAPYRQMKTPPNCHFVPLVPKMSISALRNNNVLAAAVPVGGLLMLKDIVEPLGKFGIAGKRESMSVMFFSDRPFEHMDRNCTIRLTNDSASSVRLLYYLLNTLQGHNNLPCMVFDQKAVNGELLIGDQALRKAGRIKGWGPLAGQKDEIDGKDLSIVTDLASYWRKLFDLPFVFARWMVRKDAPENVKMILREWLEEFRQKEAEMVSACIEPSARLLNIDTAVIERYFQVIHRCLDDHDLLGQERFITEFQKVDKNLLFSFASEKDGV
ncbi:MAG: hypothetical protein PVI90_08915 [Desulfobacteraceae bacterium]|jgi:predicted solute-binding protein